MVAALLASFVSDAPASISLLDPNVILHADVVRLSDQARLLEKTSADLAEYQRLSMHIIDTETDIERSKLAAIEEKLAEAHKQLAKKTVEYDNARTAYHHFIAQPLQRARLFEISTIDTIWLFAVGLVVYTVFFSKWWVLLLSS